MKRRTILKAPAGLIAVSAVGLPAINVPKYPVRWRVWPGYTAPSLKTLEILAAEFPKHRGHCMTNCAIISMNQDFWCYDCEETFSRALYLSLEKGDLDLGEPLPGYENNSFYVTDQTENLRPHLGKNALALKQMEPKAPKTGFSQVEFKNLRHLAMRCYVDGLTSEVAPRDLKRFAAILNWFADREAIGVIGNPLLMGEYLVPPVAIRLAVIEGRFNRGFIALSLNSVYTREELNAHIGGEVFVEEGGLPPVLSTDWSPRARASVEVLNLG